MTKTFFSIRSKAYFAVLLLLVLATAACRKELPQLYKPEDRLNTNAATYFETYWNGMNNNYVLWDIDPTDWDEVYRKYKPLFAKLDINKEEDSEKFYGYLKEISANLVDGHYSIEFADKTLAQITPGFERVKRRPGYLGRFPSQYFQDVIPGSYLDDDAIVATSGDKRFELVVGHIDGNILYMHVNNNYLTEYYKSENPDDEEIKEAVDMLLSEIKNVNIKGIILDMRSCFGGRSDDTQFLFSRLTDKPYLYSYIRYKNGPNRLDFGPWLPQEIQPDKEGRSLKIPVITMADMMTVSTGEVYTMATQALPNGNGIVLGQQTFGAMGALSDRVDLNAGSFSQGIFNVRMIGIAVKYKDGTFYEGKGFPPSVKLDYDFPLFQSTGRDNQLEKAVTIIREKNR